MRNRTKVITAAFIAGALAYGAPIAANAYPAGGGDFTHGTTWNTVWASYYHSAQSHSATACNGMGLCSRSDQRPGITASTQIGKSPFSGGTQAFWSTW